MSRRTNYKTKWLNALNEHQVAPSQAANDTAKVLEQSADAQISSVIELTKIHNVMMEAASSAKLLCETMDECSKFGGMDFGESTHGIDGKLGSMKLHTIARRVRDVLIMAEARIGFLSAICEDLSDANANLEGQINVLGTTSRNFVNSAIETLYIGKNPTITEISDYSHDPKRMSHHRFDVRYSDLSSDWLDTKLTSTSRHSGDEGSEEDSADEEKPEPSKSTAIVSNKTGNGKSTRRPIGNVTL